MKKLQNNWHQSQRGFFAGQLYEEMKKNKKVVLITADLGFGMWDKIQQDFPDRFINTGASECCALGITVGYAIQGYIPFCYSITNFLLYRGFEWIRNYIDYEKFNVKLIGSGRDYQYSEDGWTHQCPDAKKVMDLFPNIVQYWPNDKKEVPPLVKKMITNDRPTFLSLNRSK